MEEKCKWHTPMNLGMLQWYSEMERREKKGMKQKQCPVCGYWFFKDEYGKKPKQHTEK